jgi:hypothetical protein
MSDALQALYNAGFMRWALDPRPWVAPDGQAIVDEARALELIGQQGEKEGR